VVLQAPQWATTSCAPCLIARSGVLSLDDQSEKLGLSRSFGTEVGEWTMLNIRTIDALVEHLPKLRAGLVTALPSLGGCGEREGGGLAAGGADGRCRAHERQA
jgi:hypothetical protein